MLPYPIHLTIQRPDRWRRLQLALRLVVFLILGVVGLGFGAIFLIAFLALPAYACQRVGTHPDRYVSDDGPRVLRLVQWFGALGAWAGLATDQLPHGAPDETVVLTVDIPAHPTAKGALLRILTGIPSALVLMLVVMVGAFVWLWAALSVLASERVGAGARAYLVGLQRWTVRLLVYQAALVDAYPPFSLADATTP